VSNHARLLLGKVCIDHFALLPTESNAVLGNGLASYQGKGVISIGMLATADLDQRFDLGPLARPL